MALYLSSESFQFFSSYSSCPASSVYVGNLVPYCNQADLIPLFQAFGYITEIRMQADRGFAFIRFEKHENAAMAITNLNGTPVHGRTLRCSWGKDTGPPGDAKPAAPAAAAAAAAAPVSAAGAPANGASQEPTPEAMACACSLLPESCSFLYNMVLYRCCAIRKR